MRVPSNLAKLRRKNYLTVPAVSRRAGVPESTYEKWELLGIPKSVEYAVRIADALGVDVCELLDVREEG